MTVLEKMLSLGEDRSRLAFGMMQQLLRTLCPNSSWGRRFQDIVTHEFPGFANMGVTVADFGAYPGWSQWELWSEPTGQK